jgi:sporulation protein YlmC with PRC-barrel domain
MERMKRTLSMAAIAGLLISTSAMAETGQAQPSMPSGHGESKESQSKALDMTKTQDPTPSEYAILPLARGQKKMVGDHNLLGGDVKGKDGKSLGSLEQLIMDTKTNKIAYGVVHFSDTNEMWPLHWKSFKVNEESGEVSLNLTREQLRSRSSLDDAKDLSPDVKKMVKDMQKNMGDATINQEGIGVTKTPAGAGGQGEDQAGGAGPSGTRALPPGQAPGFEGEGKTRH